MQFYSLLNKEGFSFSFSFFWKFGFVGKRMGNREIIKRKENDYIYNQYYLKY